MSDDHPSRGPWRITGRRTVFANPWITVESFDILHPGGTPGTYGVVNFANRAIGVLPIDQTGHVWLVGQHRFPLDAYSWELPEGGGPLDADPLEAARRELKEETGLTARRWHPLCRFDMSNSVTDEEAVCFLAWDLTAGEAAPEPSEELALRHVPFAELLDMCLSGEIRDSLTLMMVLAADARARRGELPGDVTALILGDR